MRPADSTADSPLTETVLLNTAMGIVQRKVVTLYGAVMKDPLTPVMAPRQLEAVIQPDGLTRLSGMLLRHNLFTATAPDGRGKLFIANKKSYIGIPTVPAPLPPNVS
jgi:hypothetical protein